MKSDNSLTARGASGINDESPRSLDMSRLCDRLTRRHFLTVGGLGMTGLTLPALLRAREISGRPRARNVILLYMWGGPSQLETFDLKPDAPDGIRGDFKPIATRVPGTHICEHLPRLSEYADRYAIIRSVTHPGTNHSSSAYHMLTGHIHFNPGPLRAPSPHDYPSIASAVARFGRQPEGMPPSVSLPWGLVEDDGSDVAGQGAGFLGQRYAPFHVVADPTRPDFSIETLAAPSEVNGARFQNRVNLRSALSAQSDHGASAPADMDYFYDMAFRLMQSPKARRAFQLSAESPRLRERYGMNQFGQSCLLARRLVEADVPLVTVYWTVRSTPSLSSPDVWDTHADNFNRLKRNLLPPFDHGMTALLDDLRSRGLLDETLVVWFGEFGRTPRINGAAGRDHWGFCQSVLLAGAGVRGGLVHGRSDRTAAYPAELPVTPDDLAATIFQSLGIPLDQELIDPLGRPLPLCTGRPVDALFS
jgi:hypothetical protein